jgi:hypothetical protein
LNFSGNPKTGLHSLINCRITDRQEYRYEPLAKARVEPTLLKALFILTASVCIVVTAANAINAAIKAYSIKS